MTSLALPKYVYVCSTDDAAVFLDLRRGQYFGLSESERPELLKRLTPALLDEEIFRDTAQYLTQKGLLVERTGATREFAPIEISRASTELLDPYGRDRDASGPRVRIDHVVSLIWSYVRAAFLLRYVPLERIVERRAAKMQRRSRSGSASGLDAVRDLTRIFHRIRPLLYTTHEHCLFDSLVLLNFLARYSCFPMCVVGVQTAPFSAHAWVQHQSLLLNDTVARTKSFVPILSF